MRKMLFGVLPRVLVLLTVARVLFRDRERGSGQSAEER